jgi:hypothetical protein
MTAKRIRMASVGQSAALTESALSSNGGAWQGFKSHIARFPDKQVTVIVYANLAHTNQGKIANGVAGILDPDLKPKPISPIPDPAFTAKTRELFQSVLDGKADLTRFTPEVQKAITDQQEGSWRS